MTGMVCDSVLSPLSFSVNTNYQHRISWLNKLCTFVNNKCYLGFICKGALFSESGAPNISTIKE
jgi:hypothetical protein